MAFSRSHNYMENPASHSLTRSRVFIEHFRRASAVLGSRDRVIGQTETEPSQGSQLSSKGRQIKHMVTIKCDNCLAKEKTECIYTMDYYSAIKKNEIMSFAAPWMDLEIIILSEITHTEKDTYHKISLI